MMWEQCTLDNIPREFWFDLWLFIETDMVFYCFCSNEYVSMVGIDNTLTALLNCCLLVCFSFLTQWAGRNRQHTYLSDATGCCKTSTFFVFSKILMLLHQPLQTLHFDMWCVLKLMLKACPFFTLVFLLLAYSACACWIAACIVCLLFISWLDIE